MKPLCIKSCFLLPVLLLSLEGIAQQSFYKEFSGDSSETLAWAAPVQAGGYILTGYTNSIGAGNDDIFLIRISNNGSILWQKTLGETGQDRAHYVLETSDQGFLVVGETESFGLQTTATILIRTDAAGNILWSRSYKTPATGDMNAGLAAVEDAYGNFVFCGYDIVGGNTEGLMHCVDASGNNQWTYIYGGGQPEVLNRIITTSSGGYVCSGYTYSYGAGLADLFLVNVDTAGQVVWAKVLGDSAVNKSHDLIRKQDNSMMLCGTTWNGPSLQEDPFVIRLDQTGNAMWSRTYPAPGPQMGYALRQKNGGGYVMSAANDIPFSPEGHARLMCLTSSGTSFWTYDYFMSDNDAPAVVLPDSAEGWALVRHFSDSASTYRGIGWARTDSSGRNCVDSTQTTGDSLWNIQTASPGINSLLVNLISSSVNPQVSTAQFASSTICSSCNMPTAGWGYGFLGQGTFQFTDSSNFAGNWFWTFGDGDSSLLSNPFHTFADSGTYHVCLVASNSCGADTLCQDVSWTISGTEDTRPRVGYHITPNPCNGLCHLSGRNNITRVRLFDIYGRVTWQSESPSSGFVDMGHANTGVYFLEITDDHHGLSIIKVVRQ